MLARTRSRTDDGATERSRSAYSRPRRSSVMAAQHSSQTMTCCSNLIFASPSRSPARYLMIRRSSQAIDHVLRSEQLCELAPTPVDAGEDRSSRRAERGGGFLSGQACDVHEDDRPALRLRQFAERFVDRSARERAEDLTLDIVRRRGRIVH